MRAVVIDESDLKKDNPILDMLMNLSCDVSFVLDKGSFLIKCSESLPLIWGKPVEDILGAHISTLSDSSEFTRLVFSEKVLLSKILIINGITCFTHIIPFFDQNGEKVGTFCSIIHRGMDKMRDIVEEVQLEEDPAQIKSMMTRSETRYSFNDFIGVSSEILDVIKISRKAAKYDYPVLVRGETGTGKELIASGIHTESNKSSKAPFIKINCTAIPRELLESELFGHEKGAFTGAFARKQGKFEITGNGTILLDEIGDMDISLQSKLLRVLEDREFERVGGNEIIPFHGRIIASTNRNLEWMIKQGKFREDLYYRLSAIEITIPPVRNDKENVLVLLNHFMHKNDLHIPFTPGAMEILKNYDWPGNVRQIKNVVAKLSLIEDVRIFGADHIREVLMPVHIMDPYVREAPQEEAHAQGKYLGYPNNASPVMPHVTSKLMDSASVFYGNAAREASYQNAAREASYGNTAREASYGNAGWYPSSDIPELAKLEKLHITEILEKTNMNIAESARLLGISRNTLYNKIKKYQINLRKVIV